MKKWFWLLIALLLLAGCGSTAVTLAPDEPLTNDFAYIIGKKLDQSSGVFEFVTKGENGRKSFYLAKPPSGALYVIQKVQPGTYVFEYSFYESQYIPSTSSWKSVRSSSAQMGSVQLEAGKINYIGTIDVQRSRAGISFGGVAYRAVSSISYNQEEVKAFIKKHHPQLAKELEATFVTKPLR